MSTAAATAVAFAVAAALSFVAPRRSRWLLVVGVLVVPIALATPSFVRAQRRDAARSTQRPLYSTPRPFRWRFANPPLIAGIVEHVPAHASISILDGNLEIGSTRWLAYQVAPRQLMNTPALWTIVFSETPTMAGLHPRHAWRYDLDWLVQR